MNIRCSRFFIVLLFLPLLSACVDDRAAWEVGKNGQGPILTLIREQPYFWDKKVNFSLVVARMPDCMRRHDLGAAPAGTQVQVFQVPSGAFIIRAGKRLFATEAETCESFAPMETEPASGLGQFMGTFVAKNGVLAFEVAAPELR